VSLSVKELLYFRIIAIKSWKKCSSSSMFSALPFGGLAQYNENGSVKSHVGQSSANKKIRIVCIPN